MNKKKFNILTVIMIVFSLLCLTALIFPCNRFGKYIYALLKAKREMNDNEKWLAFYSDIFATNLSVFIVCLFAALFCVGVAVFLIYLLYRINKTELLAATEDVNAYRKRKAAERNARRKAKAEKKKAAIERELAALNSAKENDFSEK